MERSILILLNKNITYINELRHEFDPLYEYIKPHITIVFPFKSDLNDEQIMISIQDVIHEVKKFRIVLKGFSKHISKDGYYIYHDIVYGLEQCFNLHEILYKETFAIKNEDYEYIPHVTVGKFDNKVDMERAYQSIDKSQCSTEMLVESIVLEKIGVKGESIIIKTFDLK